MKMLQAETWMQVYKYSTGCDNYGIDKRSGMWVFFEKLRDGLAARCRERIREEQWGYISY